MSCIVTTVGASLFTNYLEKSDFIKADYKAIKDALHQDWDNKQVRICSIKKNADFKNWISRNLKDSCAEIASLLTIIEIQKIDVRIRLLATDTVLSRLAAELIMEQIITHPVSGEDVTVEFYPERDVIRGLRIDDAEVFETEGLHQFVKRFAGLDKQYGPLILNITGGYKGLIPYLTLIAQLYNAPVMYKYEESEALITIPQWPINFDSELAIEYGDQLRNVNKINDYDKLRLIKKHLLDPNGELTPLGMILKDYAKTVDGNQFLNENLRGDCAEFRWFEYYVSEYPNWRVRRSVGKGSQEIAGKRIEKEADIVVEGDGKIIIAESKSLKYIYDRGEKVISQVDELLQEVKQNGIDVHEYHLCLYSAHVKDISECFQHPTISCIQRIVHKYYPDCTYILKLMRNVSELQSFMHKSFFDIQKDVQSLTLSAT
jgi:CRISPR/Cas system-associated protein Csm6